MSKFTVDSANAFAAEIRTLGLLARVDALTTCDYSEETGKYGPKYTLIRVQVTASDPSCPAATQELEITEVTDAAKLAKRLVADVKKVVKAKGSKSARLAAKWSH